MHDFPIFQHFSWFFNIVHDFWTFSYFFCNYLLKVASGVQVACKWRASGAQVASKWRASGVQVACKWRASGMQGQKHIIFMNMHENVKFHKFSSNFMKMYENVWKCKCFIKKACKSHFSPKISIFLWNYTKHFKSLAIVWNIFKYFKLTILFSKKM